MNRAGRPRVVAGFGRSGTTWVQDAVAQANCLRAVFEPLHPLLLRDAGLEQAGYHRAEDNDPALEAYLERYFLGHFHSLWADYRVIGRMLLPFRSDITSLRGLKRLYSANATAIRNILRFRAQRSYEERLTKFVRANVMLAWVKRTFDARIVYIVRHPAAVVLSQMRAPRAWHPRKALSACIADSRWMNSLNAGTVDLLRHDLDDVEAHALQWCIEVGTAITQCRESEIPVVFYEELIEYGDPEWTRILNALELHEAPSEELVDRPSQQAWGEKARQAGLVRRYDSWMRGENEEVLTRVQRVLDRTSSTVYHTDQALPADADGIRPRPEHSA